MNNVKAIVKYTCGWIHDGSQESNRIAIVETDISFQEFNKLESSDKDRFRRHIQKAYKTIWGKMPYCVFDFEIYEYEQAQSLENDKFKLIKDPILSIEFYPYVNEHIRALIYYAGDMHNFALSVLQELTSKDLHTSIDDMIVDICRQLTDNYQDQVLIFLKSLGSDSRDRLKVICGQYQEGFISKDQGVSILGYLYEVVGWEQSILQEIIQQKKTLSKISNNRYIANILLYHADFEECMREQSNLSSKSLYYQAKEQLSGNNNEVLKFLFEQGFTRDEMIDNLCGTYEEGEFLNPNVSCAIDDLRSIVANWRW